MPMALLTHSLHTPTPLQVLTSGMWPQTTAAPTCNLPRELEQCTQEFMGYYLHANSGKDMLLFLGWAGAGVTGRACRWVGGPGSAQAAAQPALLWFGLCLPALLANCPTTCRLLTLLPLLPTPQAGG